MYKQFVALVLTVCGVACNASMELVFAVDVMRHGMRTPIIPLKVDPIAWPVPPGFLLPQGYFRACYRGTVQAAIQRHQGWRPVWHQRNSGFRRFSWMTISATHIRRTQDSARAFMVGFMSGQCDHLTQKLRNPFYKIPLKTQFDIHFAKRNPGDVDINIAKPLSIKRIQRAARQCPSWQKAAQSPIDDQVALTHLADAIEMRHLLGHAVPRIIDQPCLQKLMRMYHLYWRYAYAHKKQYHAMLAPMMRLIKHGLQQYLHGSRVRYQLYVAHDDNVTALLSALGIHPRRHILPATIVSLYFLRDRQTHRLRVAARANGRPLFILACHASQCGEKKFWSLF